MKENLSLCILLLHVTISKGSHSLWMMGVYIRGQTQFPEFTAYLMLDDIEFAYYDSNGSKVIYRDKGLGKEFDEDYTYIFESLRGRIKHRASNVKNYFNKTNDFDVFQRVTGCELLDNDRPGMMVTKDAYNGNSLVLDYYDVHHDALHIDWILPEVENKSWTKRMNFPVLYREIYHPYCIKYLRKHLNTEKNRVLKKVKPRVRLLQKTLPDNGGVMVTCLATGFYPRHINLTLFRDDEPVPDHQMTGGELLPNGDETYQMRKSLEISAEELQHHNYTCTAEHLSLDNKLNIILDFRPGADTLVLAVPPVVGFGIAFLLLCAVWATVALCNRRYAAKTGTDQQQKTQQPLLPHIIFQKTP